MREGRNKEVIMPKHSHHEMSISKRNEDPDKGPAMREGAHHFDKGYVSDEEYALGSNSYPAGERGNRYAPMQNEIRKKDDKKLVSNKFTKIA